MKIHPPFLLSTIESQVARHFAAGAFRRVLPPIENTPYRLSVNSPFNRRGWQQASVSFLVSAAPYYVLLVCVGKWAIINPATLVFITARQANPLITVTVFTLLSILAFPRLLKRRKQRKILGVRRFRDSSHMTAIAFFAESETWTERQRLRACAAYSVALQTRGIFPIFTVLTAIVGNRLAMATYHSELARTGSREAALCHVLTVRLMRLTLAVVTAGFFGLATILA